MDVGGDPGRMATAIGVPVDSTISPHLHSRLSLLIVWLLNLRRDRLCDCTVRLISTR